MADLENTIYMEIATAKGEPKGRVTIQLRPDLAPNHVAQIKALDAPLIGEMLTKADLLEQWITDLRALAFQMLHAGGTVPGYKLVPKRATRQWVDPEKARAALEDLGLDQIELMETKLLSPAQAEKKVKNLPEGLTVSVSSGDTVAPESDPRPAVLKIGQHLAALTKLI